MAVRSIQREGTRSYQASKTPGPMTCIQHRKIADQKVCVAACQPVRVRARECATCAHVCMCLDMRLLTQRDPQTGMADGQFYRRQLIRWTPRHFLLQSCYVRRKNPISEHELCAGAYAKVCPVQRREIIMRVSEDQHEPVFCAGRLT